MNNFLTADLRVVTARVRKDPVVPDQPLIFQYFANHVELFQEPTIFIHEKFVRVGGTPSPNTWGAGAYDLLTWLQSCQLKGIDWRDATEADRQEYAEDYDADGRDEKGTNRKLSTIRRFYEFARTEGWYHRDIGTSLEQRHISNRPIDDDPQAHTRLAVGRTALRDPLLRKAGRKDVVRPLQLKQLKKLLEHLGPVTHTAGDMRTVRNRLICDLAWVAGARLGDVVSLTTLKFLSITVEPHEMYVEFPLIVVGKGKVTRNVSAPGWLILAIQSYINAERAASEHEGKKRGAKTTTALFLGHAGSKSAGKPITRSAIQKMFALACMKCGITSFQEAEDLETGEKRIKTVPAHSFHDLRHNCAVITYHAERQRGNSEPWKVVQIKLGHRSVKVTMDTYLAHIEIFGEKQRFTDVLNLIKVAA
jgi:integrase